LELAALVVGHCPAKRIVANLAQKVHVLIFYLYGPIHCIGPVWSEHPQTLKEIGEALRLAARCEPDLLAADNRPADAALLVANTSEMYSVYTSWGFAAERIAVFHALLNAQVPVEIVGEEEIIEDDALSRYRVLYVADSHVDSRAQEKIKEWVRGGGTLWASSLSLIRKEYDEDSRAFDEVFGLKSRGEVVPLGTAQAEGAPGVVTVQAGEKLGDARLTAPGPQPRYELSTGRAIGRFEDGSPAVVLNEFGKGRAFLCGFRLAATSLAPGAAAAGGAEQAGKPVRSLCVEVAADAGGVRRHVRLGVPRVHTWVHDGPEQTVVFLINETGGALAGVPLEVVLPRPVRSAYSGSGREVKFTATADGAAVTLEMPEDGCEILVFK